VKILCSVLNLSLQFVQWCWLCFCTLLNYFQPPPLIRTYLHKVELSAVAEPDEWTQQIPKPAIAHDPSHIHLPLSLDILCLRPDWHRLYQSRQLHTILSHFSAPPTLTTEFPKQHITAIYLSFPRHTKESGYRSRNSDSLRSGLSGDRFPVGSRFSAPVQNGCGAQPLCCKWVPVLFPDVKVAGAWRWPASPI
jgi:hypothetical protein